MGMLKQMFGGGDDDLKDDIRRASETAAGGQEKAEGYLREQDRLPSELREGALRLRGGAYGIPGFGGSEAFIDEVKGSPLYKNIIGGREAGENAILRNAAATGGLRSGNTQHSMYKYNTELENKALLDSYNNRMQGLESLSGLPSLALPIANTMTGAADRRGQGATAATQAGQTSGQQGFENIIGGVNTGMSLYNMFQ